MGGAYLIRKWLRMSKGTRDMKKMKNALIVGALIVVVGGVIVAKRQRLAEPPKMDAATEAVSTKIVPTETAQEQPMRLPRLLDLGADKCIP